MYGGIKFSKQSSKLILYCIAILSLIYVAIPGLTYADAPAINGTVNGTVNVTVQPASVKVRVRTVRATGLTDNLTDISLSSPNHYIGDGLKDIEPQLKKLNFTKFRLVSSQQEIVPLMKKQTIYLVEGNTLAVRPLYTDGNKIGLWLKWIDGTGMQVLDTRMHFRCGESMITGTDGSGDTGTILAIDVTRSE